MLCSLVDFAKVKNPYDFFELPVDCTEQDIKNKFRFYAKKLHPDKNQDPTMKRYYARQFQEMKESYDILTKQRAEYDSWFRESNRTTRTGQQQQYQTGTQEDFNDYFRNQRTWTAEEMAERIRHTQRERTESEARNREAGRSQREQAQRERILRRTRERRRTKKIFGLFILGVVAILILIVVTQQHKNNENDLKISYNLIPTDLQTMLDNPHVSYCGNEDTELTIICYYDFDSNGKLFTFSLANGKEMDYGTSPPLAVDISKLPRTDIGSNHFAYLDWVAYDTCYHTDGLNSQCLNAQHNKFFSSGISKNPLTIMGQQPKIKQQITTLQNKIGVNLPPIQDKVQNELTNNFHKCMRADPIYHNYIFTGRYNYVPCD